MSIFEKPVMRTDIRSLYKYEDVRPEAIIDNLIEVEGFCDRCRDAILRVFWFHLFVCCSDFVLRPPFGQKGLRTLGTDRTRI